LTAVALIAVPILLVSIKVFGGAMRSRGMAAQQAESKVYSLIHQGITALPLIQSHAREHHEQRRFTTHTERARQNKMAQQGREVDGPAELPTSADDMFAPAGAPAVLPGRPLQIYGNVDYDDVSFAYEPSRPALRHISFKLLAGTSVAIIGPSGAGKTTLLNLL